MEGYIKLRKSLSSKGRRSKSSPPRSTPHDSDFDHNLAAQIESVNKSVDQKLEVMSSSLMSRFSSMLDSFQLSLNQTSFPEDSAVPGYSSCLLEPPSLRPTVSTKSCTGLRFREGEEDPVPHDSGLASARHNLDETPETVRHPPSGDTGKPQDHSQRAPGFSKESRLVLVLNRSMRRTMRMIEIRLLKSLLLTKHIPAQFSIFMIGFLTRGRPQLHVYHRGASLRNFLQLLMSLQRLNRIYCSTPGYRNW